MENVNNILKINKVFKRIMYIKTDSQRKVKN